MEVPLVPINRFLPIRMNPWVDALLVGVIALGTLYVLNKRLRRFLRQGTFNLLFGFSQIRHAAHALRDGIAQAERAIERARRSNRRLANSTQVAEPVVVGLVDLREARYANPWTVVLRTAALEERAEELLRSI